MIYLTNMEEMLSGSYFWRKPAWRPKNGSIPSHTHRVPVFHGDGKVRQAREWKGSTAGVVPSEALLRSIQGEWADEASAGALLVVGGVARQPGQSERGRTPLRRNFKPL